MPEADPPTTPSAALLVVVPRIQEARPLLHWAFLLGRARGFDVVALYAETKPGQDVVRESAMEEPEDAKAPKGVAKALVEAAAQARDAVRLQPASAQEDEGVPTFTVVTVESKNPLALVLDQIETKNVKLLLIGRDGNTTDRHEGADGPELCTQLLHRAPCHVLLLRPGADPAETGEKILVPTAGGPHARVALGLAADLATASEGRVTALYVQTDLGTDAETLAARALDRVTARVSEAQRERIDTEVVLAKSVLEGVVERAEEYDLVLLGTSSQPLIRRVLFKTIPERILAGPEGTSVAVLRRSIPLPVRWEQAFVRGLHATVPQMGRAERVALVERLQQSSYWSFDFVLLTGLATLIAALGLVAGNIAVVIGAMLVAPLMTPLIGAGLALVQGNLVFLRRTHLTVALGYLLAVGIGALVGLIARPEVTVEMASRGHPGVLDLVVAFASGLAAAYAVGRPNLSAALPGVAISASLVPPIATTGIALTIGAWWLAAGAALLFFTNMVAIILGSSVSLLATGMRGEHLHGRQKDWTRRTWIAVFVFAALLAILLSFWLAHVAAPAD